jgi:hypothetical protein
MCNSIKQLQMKLSIWIAVQTFLINMINCVKHTTSKWCWPLLIFRITTLVYCLVTVVQMHAAAHFVYNITLLPYHHRLKWSTSFKICECNDVLNKCKTLVHIQFTNYGCESRSWQLLNHLKPNGNYMSHLLQQSVTLHFVFMCSVCFSL